MPILQSGDTVGLISCSDGLRQEEASLLNTIVECLESFQLKVQTAKTIFKIVGPFSGSPNERAHELTCMFRNPNIKAIFDISGGDSANQILPYLDYRVIKNNPKPFFGISDVSVVLNALYAYAGLRTYHYSVRVLCGTYAILQRQRFRMWFLDNIDILHDIKGDISWIRGHEMEGTIVGGNIRCFLKLAGTPYMPHPEGTILFLESLGGLSNRIASLLSQLDQIGYFDVCNGILLGTFTQAEYEQAVPSVSELSMEITERSRTPIAKSGVLGHGDDALVLPIGTKLSFNR